MKLNNVIVVIRSVKERTEQLCLKYVLREVIEENVYLIHEKPFRKAVIKNFQIGIENELKWTLAIDADVLLKENAIKEMIFEAEKLSNKYFLYQGLIFDRFFNQFKSGGPHLYRTKMLNDLIHFVPKDGESLRPESDSFHGLVNRDYHYFNDNKFYGLHDFEQNYFDIYRKFFLHAKKHTSSIERLLINFKKSLATNLDNQMALRGLVDGLLYKEEIFVNTEFFKEKYSSAQFLGVKEKKLEVNEDYVKSFFKELKTNSTKKIPIRDSSKKKNKQSVITRIIKRIMLKLYVKSEKYLY